MKNKGGAAIVHEAWDETYKEAGAKHPDCWNNKPMMLKPDGHTVSTSDLFFVGHYLKMAATLLGEIDHVVANGVITTASGEKPNELLECGVLIKCVGFHINAANEKILGERKEFRAIGLIDDQLWCQLESHLDKTTFNLPFGSSYISSVNFVAKLISKGWREPETMAKMLSTPKNSNVTTFSTTELFESVQAIQAVVPDVKGMMHEQVVEVRNRFNSTLLFKEYLDRNEVQWNEYHLMCYPKTPVVNPRRKPQLKWRFRPFEAMVIAEWDRFNKRQAAKAVDLS
mmetsp:Transcript_88994/g.267661  ORF Transcript_88994/g.267661 Transcript_88994/m.267661 type:complete len:284 (-) Transcript_88994:158-1009(-)